MTFVSRRVVLFALFPSFALFAGLFGLASPANGVALPASHVTSARPEIVSFPNGKLTLHGVIYKPEGAGPFPAIVYNHGSAPGMMSAQAFATLGPVFAGHGWLFF